MKRGLVAWLILAGLLLWLAPEAPAQQRWFEVSDKHYQDDVDDFIPWYAVIVAQQQRMGAARSAVVPQPLPPTPGPPGPGPQPLPPTPEPPPCK